MILRLVFLVFPWFLGACASNVCNPQTRSLAQNGMLYFRLADARTGEPLWSTDSIARPRFALDSARLQRGTEKKWTLHDFSGTGRVGFVLVSAELDSLPLHTDLTERYLLFPSKSDVDTIDVHYILQQNDCGFREYRTIHVLYNRTLAYGDSGVSRLPTLTFRKQKIGNFNSLFRYLDRFRQPIRLGCFASLTATKDCLTSCTHRSTTRNQRSR